MAPVPLGGDDLALATAAALAAVVLGWHLLGLAWCAAAHVWPRARLLRRLSVLAPPLVRRAVGAAGVASFALAPVAAYAAPPNEEPFVRAPAPVTSTTPPRAPIPAPAPVPAPAPAPVASAPAPAPRASRTHVVVTGDNLWRIAAAEVAHVSGNRQPTAATIVPYWQRVVTANRTTLRSGDPSLIYPGEIVTLPD